MSRVPTIQPVPYYAALHSSRLVETRWPRTIGTIRKFAHGAGSALLVFAGADSLNTTANAAQNGAPAQIDFTSVDGVLQSVLSGGLAGPLQIAGAAFLFFAAGKCMARLLGLLAVGAIVLLYMQGVTITDAWGFMARFAERLSAAQTAFMTAEVG
jgi:hypothetical protein